MSDCNCHTRKPKPEEHIPIENLRVACTGEDGCEEHINYGYADLVPDRVNPAHYSIGDEQVWDFIARKKLDYFEGNVVKYVCRSPYKGEQVSDLKKAIAYLRKKIELVERPIAPKT